jgi:hypothetical protein
MASISERVVREAEVLVLSGTAGSAAQRLPASLKSSK